MIPAGILRERFAIEAPTETRNELGESVQTWDEVGRVWGSYEALSYVEQARRGQIGGSIAATVRIRFFPGLAGNMRLRWISRDDRLLYVSAIVERGRREEHELEVQESVS